MGSVSWTREQHHWLGELQVPHARRRGRDEDRVVHILQLRDLRRPWSYRYGPEAAHWPTALGGIESSRLTVGLDLSLCSRVMELIDNVEAVTVRSGVIASCAAKLHPWGVSRKRRATG
jgi:hypothetical protein